MVRRAVAAFAALVLGARAAPGRRVRPRDAAVDRARARARSSTSRPPRSRSASTRPSRRASARCASSTPRARRSRPARPSTRTARARRSRSSSSPGWATAPTRRPTASCRPTATPVSSGFVFTVGEASAPVRVARPAARAGGGTGSITNTALAVARAIQYAAIALGLGALIFFAFCWRRAGVTSRAFTERLERILLVAALAGLLSAVAALVLQGAVGEGGSFWAAARPGHRRRGPRDALRPRLGHRRAAVDRDADRPRDAAAAAARRDAARSGGRARPDRRRLGGPNGAEPRGGVAGGRAPVRPLATATVAPPPPSRPPASRRSRSRSACSRCCRRSAVTRACSRRWRCCCPRTSSTCSR